MDLSSADFMRFSVQELADMLSEKLSENMSEGKEVSSVKLHGLVDGRMFEMDVVMREVDQV